MFAAVVVMLFLGSAGAEDAIHGLAKARQKWEGLAPCQRSFLRGFAAYKAGRLNEAEGHFLACDGKYPLLQNYITEYLEKIAGGGEKFDYVDPAAKIAREIMSLERENPSSERDFNLATAYFRARNYKKAAELFKNLAGDAKFRLASLEYLATSLVRQEKGAEAIEINRQIIGEFAKNKTTQQKARFKLAFIYIDQKKYGEAREAFKELKKTFPAYRRGDVWWYIAWCSFKLGEFKTAAGQFAALEKIGGKEQAARAKYWQAKSLEALGEKPKADRIYAAVAAKFSGSYYGILSVNEVGVAVEPHPQHKSPLPSGERVRVRGENNDALATAMELEKLGLGELVAKELERLTGLKKGRPAKEKIYEIAIRNDAWRVVFLLGEKYPKSYPRFVHAAAQKNKIEKELVWAVLREESTFRPDAVSRSGAIGLMQLMPATAQKMARLKKMDFRLKDLFSPKYNIELGTKYLGFLSKYFDGNLYYVTAAYNAGEEAVTRWIAKGETNPAEFVEEIPYRETQDYVRKVMRSYWMYRKTGR